MEEIASDKEKSLCSICQKPMSEGDSSVSCCGPCGKHQHARCLNFYEEESVNIKWKCNDCLNKNGNILEVSEELLDHPVENCNIIIEENIEDIGYSEKCPETSSYTEENAVSKSSTETNSKIILVDKHDTNENLNVIEIEMIDENVNLNNISIDGEVTDENVNLNKMSTDGEVTHENDNVNKMSTDGEVTHENVNVNKMSTDGEGTDENIYVNNISIDGEVTEELTLSPKREVRDSLSPSPQREVSDPLMPSLKREMNNALTSSSKREVTDSLMPSRKRQKKSNSNRESSDNLNSDKIEYIILEKMTKNNKPRLFDSLGYSYNLKTTANEWLCVRKGKNYCAAVVKQTKNIFKPLKKHNHPGNVELFISAQKEKKETLSLDTPKIPEVVSSESKVSCKNVKDINAYTKRIESSRRSERIENLEDNESPKDEDNTPKKDEGELLQETCKVNKPVDQKKDTNQGIASKNLIKPSEKKSVYILLENENDGSLSKLFDQTLGFTYNLYKTMDRTKVWLCTKSESIYKCEAAVKQVGNFFIRSRMKHNHKNSKRLEQSQENLKKSPNNIRASTTSANSTSEAKILQQDNLENIAKQDLGSKKKLSSKSPYKQTVSERRKAPAKSKKPVVKHSENVEEDDVDEHVIKILISLHKVGVYLTNKVILDNVQEYVLQKNPEVNVNRMWVSDFCKKYQTQLGDKYIKKSAYKNLISLSLSRVCSLFTNLEKLLNSHDIKVSQMLSEDNSNRIYNCDVMELAVNINVTKGKDGSRSSFNILCCINASGQSTKPVIINKGTKILKYETSKEFEGCYSSMCSTTGEFTEDMFYTWLSQDFTEYLIEKNIKTPVLLIINGAHIPISWTSLNFANNNGIILFQLPLYIIRSRQPLTCGVLQTIRKTYRNLEDKLSWSSDRVCKHFPALFLKAYNQIDMIKLSEDCFRVTGFCPLDEIKLTSLKPTEEIKPDVATFDSVSDFESFISNDNTVNSSVPDSNGNTVSLSVPDSNLNTVNSSVQESNDNTDNSSVLDSPDDIEDNFSNISIDSVEKDSKIPSVTISDTDLPSSSRSHEEPKNSFKTSNLSPADERKNSIDKLSLKMGYKLAQSHMEKVFRSILEPTTIEMFERYLETDVDVYDTNFALWKGLQKLKEVPDLLGCSKNNMKD